METFAMWRDSVKDRYWWIKVRNEMEELLWELSKAEDDEETDLYLLRLHFDNESDLNFFTETEKREIKRLLSILMTDTKKHRNLLIEISKELKGLGEGHAGQAL